MFTLDLPNIFSPVMLNVEQTVLAKDLKYINYFDYKFVRGGLKKKLDKIKTLAQ